MRFLFLLLSFIAISAYAKIEVIDTTRQAETLLPMVRGILNAESTVQAYQQQLIIHASADEIAQVKNLLARIDKIGRTLMITVKKKVAAQVKVPLSARINKVLARKHYAPLKAVIALSAWDKAAFMRQAKTKATGKMHTAVFMLRPMLINSA